MQTKALRLLDKNCYELARELPYLHTSPMSGILHGDYRFRGNGDLEVFEIFSKTQGTAYTEFGIPACSPVDVLKSFLPEDQWWPPRRGTCWEDHHAFEAWDGDRSSWLMLPAVEFYFGTQNSLEDLAANAAWLQSAGYQFIFEEARRQKPVCSMALNWCFNEPWPTAANNSLVNWPARPRPALEAVGNALRPTLASLRIPKFSYSLGETFSVSLHLLHDGLDPLDAQNIRVWLVIGTERIHIGDWSCPATGPNQNQQGPEFSIQLPFDATTNTFTLLTEVEGFPQRSSHYHHLIKP
jgi:beta-mannosidase